MKRTAITLSIILAVLIGGPAWGAEHTDIMNDK